MRKRRKGFQVNKETEPELTVDDILAEYSAEKDMQPVDYDSGWAEPAYEGLPQLPQRIRCRRSHHV